MLSFGYTLCGQTQKMLFSFKNNKVWAENLQIIMQIGLTMAGCIIFCFYVGYKIDQWLDTKGVFITVFTILGVIGGGNVVYRQIIQIMEAGNGKEDKEEKKDS